MPHARVASAPLLAVSEHVQMERRQRRAYGGGLRQEEGAESRGEDGLHAVDRDAVRDGQHDDAEEVPLELTQL